jgi:hypothetical membrane protein
MTSIRANNLIRVPFVIVSALPSRARADAWPSRVPGWALVSAALAPLVLTSSWLIADALQPPRYSPMRQTVSVLAGYAGTDRWLMTGGLAAVGVCYFVTTAGLRDIPIAARIVLLVTGIAAVGVAACPQPVHGSTVAHMFWTGVGELALAALPAIIGLHRLDHRLLNARESAVVAGLFGAMFLWLVVELRGGTHLGLAERLTSSVQTCWPLVMALALRHSTRVPDEVLEPAVSASRPA